MLFNLIACATIVIYVVQNNYGTWHIFKQLLLQQNTVIKIIKCNVYNQMFDSNCILLNSH